MNHSYGGRREDHRLVTGRGKYTADWYLPGEAFAYFVRSDHARADISAIDTMAALEMPGVLAVLTGEDIERAGIKLAPPTPAPNRAGIQEIKIPEREILAKRRVCYVGQPVALIIAEQARQAQDAAEALNIQYHDLPAIVDAEEALAEDAVELDLNVPGNLCFEYEYGDREATDAAFATAAHITQVRLESQRLIGNPMEPKACIAAFDDATGVFDIYCPTQGLSMIRDRFAEGLGVPEEQVRIHAHDVGGGFGVRIEAYPEYLALALAAKTTKRPVKWVSTRSETMVSDFHGRGLTLYGELALAADGTFLAIRHRWIVNAGAYPSTSGALVTTIGPSIYLVGPYRTPLIHGVHKVALTNTVPTTPYRGSARPSVSYVIERLIDEAAHETGIDRFELRRRNLLGREAFPYRTPVGSVYDSGDPIGLLDTAAEAADLEGFLRRRAESEKNGKLRGLGVSVFIESAGGGRVPREETAIKFSRDGSATIYTLSGASGQGHETIFPMIVAETLGIQADLITLNASAPEGPNLKGDGSVGSRSAMTHGSSLVATAREVIGKGMPLAASYLEVPESALTFRDGLYVASHLNRSVGLLELVQMSTSGQGSPLDTASSVPSSQNFPSGAHICEVEVDPQTGEYQVLSYVAVDDCGNVISPVLVEGQVHGGVMQGFGQVFGEHCLYDESGQLVTGSFMDYFMPRADSSFPIHVIDYPVPSPTNLLGAKGVGEAGTTGALPCFANAVIDAMRPLGVNHLDLPYTPHRLWQAMQESSGAA
ncbi:Ald_Xan_dh_C domain-containing protein [Hyphomicrobiales bacterium]|nr:Ald_Xan_dh_C domain-containing protein [Hyphomicrobiales bacterium]